MLILQGTGWWVCSRVADTDADLSNARGHAMCTCAPSSAPSWPAAVWGVAGPQVSQSEGRVGPGSALHSLSWDWAAAAGRGGRGPGCTWSQSHVATSVSNAFCCCAWPADAVLERSYATSVIHTCIISWLCCSWEAADSKKFPRTWEKPNGTDECIKTSSATQALGTQHPFSFFSICEAMTMKLTSWILIFKTLYVLCLMSLGR